MASQIDPTIPPDNVKVDKAKLRQNFATAATESTKSLRQGRLPYRTAYGIVNLFQAVNL